MTKSTTDDAITETVKKSGQALQSSDSLEIAKAQLELTRAMIVLLQGIDWKLWELYKKYVDTKTK